MKVLVTGGTGFVGRVLVRRILSEEAWTVRLLVRDLRKAGKLNCSRVEVVQGNLRDQTSLRAAVEGVEIVFHLAAPPAGTWEDYLEEAVGGTERLVRAALQAEVRRFVFVSTIRVTEAEGDPLSRAGHLSYQTKSKALAERIIVQGVAESGLDAVIVRPGIVFGPGDVSLPRLGLSIGSRLVLVSRRDTLIPTVFVEHAAAAILLAGKAGRPGEVYDVVDDEPVSRLQYLRMLKQHWDPSLTIIQVPDPAVRLVRSTSRWLSTLHPLLAELVHPAVGCGPAHYSNSKLKGLGWRQARPTAETLLQTIQSYKQAALKTLVRTAWICAALEAMPAALV
jgi:nucleoside-diphosphate-sugar epimerase